MAKRLIVCCDGTWNFADQPSKTNVAKVALSVRSGTAAGKEQRVYYHSGVGTRRRERLRGGAFGAGLSQNIVDAYRFLVETYEPGDELFLFGFSRGAFTARSLAGLTRNCGIVRRDHTDRIPEAWGLYRDRIEQPNGAAATLFRRSYARETEIRFIGVWDTVGSLGIPVPDAAWLQPAAKRFNRRWAFHNTELSGWVRAAFHALAIDEQRSAFRPTLWHQQPGAAEQGQELQQVWFSGVHCDVGGGYKETGLSDIPLLWMVDQARRHGLEFDPDALSEAGPKVMKPEESIDFRVRPDALGSLHSSRTGMYKLAKPLHRPIAGAANDKGEPDGNEFLAVPAKERYDQNSDYRPPELERYLARPDRIRLEPVLLPGLASGLPPLPSAPSAPKGPAATNDDLHRTT
ncbi:putative alpha/beta hydrolase family protein DUF2235 [Streptomyces sp. TLI_55]|uniref:DUF2235 domain-containing protein n=1 Tax=Streptomyces sp. TLI_55 TaxID=1938861 RepID=UPI000BD236AC|nr:DUF2235 domain-containing protein [Streptomyces sp. TLI_55]SNX55708.1 putative alpha/beta hydrolase family protein DUF2235 [Streptomyces sp. TLI_55]